jgi:NAD(P)-dependent dehydrogenase (short-subunit alcohol dehydrogenase family)
MASAKSLVFNTIFNLSGRVALVTGGGSGIGLMIAGGLAANGAKVYVASRRLEMLNDVCGKWAQQGIKMHPYVYRISLWNVHVTRIVNKLACSSM